MSAADENNNQPDTPTSVSDIWGWNTLSNQRSDLFKDRPSTISTATSTSTPRIANASATPTLTRPFNPAEHTKKASFPIGIPIGVSLGVLALLAIALFWLGKKGKLRRFTPYRNPYAKQQKKEEQLRRLEAVEEDRVQRGVVLMGRKEVPIERLGGGGEGER